MSCVGLHLKGDESEFIQGTSRKAASLDTTLAHMKDLFLAQIFALGG